MKSTAIVILALVSLVLALDAEAQWTTQTSVNTLVSTATTDDIKSIGTSDGKTWVAFWKQVPAPAYYEMWAQLIDVNGDTLLGPEGMLVNNVVPMSSYTTLWTIEVDELGNLFIGFNGTGSANTVYVHKISTAGIQLWGSNGVVLGTGFDPKILPIQDGGAIVSWLPGNNGLMQRLSSSGSTVWAAAVTVPPGVAGNRSSAGEMLAHPNGDFTVLIHNRAGVSPSSYLYAQRFSGMGVALWPAPIQISNIGTVYNRRYTAIADQDTVYLGYSGAIGMVFHSYFLRINPAGTLPWGINGVDFSTQSTDYEMDTKIAFKSGSQYIWAICEYKNSSQSQSGEYVQKFDKGSGARLLTNIAKQVFPISTNDNSHKGSLQLSDDQPIFMVSNGTNNSFLPIDLRAVLLDQSGNFVWPGQTTDMATYSSFKSRVEFTRNVGGQSVGVWCENRGSGSRIYAQNISTCIGPTAAFTFTSNNYDVSFTSGSTLADSLFWDFGDGSSGIGASISHTYQDTGTYTVCLIARNACGSDTLCLTVNVTCPYPVAGFSVSSNFLAITLTSLATGSDTVFWDFGDGSSAYGDTVQHTYAQAGTYSICQVAKNDCGNDTLCYSVTVIANGLGEEGAGTEVLLYPNPCSDVLYVDISIGGEDGISYSIIDLHGQIISDGMLLNDMSSNPISLSGLRPGIYIIQFNINGVKHIRRVCKTGN